MYNPIEVSQAAKKALAELRQSGGAGYDNTVFETIDFVEEYDDSWVFVTPLEVGKTYRLTLASGVYTATAKNTIFTDEEGSVEAVYFGNLALMGDGEDTGESYIAFYLDGMGAVADANSGGNCTLEVGNIRPVKIAPRYLPGVQATVHLTDFSFSIIASQKATASDENAAILDELVADGVTCFVLLLGSEETEFHPIVMAYTASLNAWIGSGAKYTYVIQKTDGVWYAWRTDPNV